MRRVRNAKVGKWACAGLAVLVSVVGIANLHWGVYWLTGSTPPMWQVTIARGLLVATHFDTPGPGAMVKMSRGPVGVQVARIGSDLRLAQAPGWSDTTNPASMVRVRTLAVPLWPGAWVLGLFALACWWFDRNPAGHCARCGYDLRGIKDGTCPECGAHACAR